MWNKWSDLRNDKIGTCCIPAQRTRASLLARALFLISAWRMWKVLTLLSHSVPVSNLQFMPFFVFSGKPFYMFLCVFLLLVAVMECENQEEVEKRGSFPGQVQAAGWTVLSPMHPRESGEKTWWMKGLFEHNKRTNSQRQMGKYTDLGSPENLRHCFHKPISWGTIKGISERQ